MIILSTGPLICQPKNWTLVFNRRSATRWAAWLAMGRYKHVRAYAYVPYLHVWVFFDPKLSGIDIIIAADGEPANTMIAAWIFNADLVRMQRSPKYPGFPLLGFCVPAIKRLLGLRCVSLRPDALYAYCLKNGGVPFEGLDGTSEIRTSAT